MIPPHAALGSLEILRPLSPDGPGGVGGGVNHTVG